VLDNEKSKIARIPKKVVPAIFLFRDKEKIAIKERLEYRKREYFMYCKYLVKNTDIDKCLIVFTLNNI